MADDSTTGPQRGAPGKLRSVDRTDRAAGRLRQRSYVASPLRRPPWHHAPAVPSHLLRRSGLAKLGPSHLACRSSGECIDSLPRLGTFGRGESLFGASTQVLWRRGADVGGADPLAPAFIRAAEHGDFNHPGQILECGLDLSGIDIDTAADDQVLAA